MLIKTANKPNGKILVKGGKRQRTIDVDPARSFRENHTHAMIVLANAHGTDKTFPRTEVFNKDHGSAAFTLNAV